jgi:sulfhydrogenase subunit beta (sulfur reductase)
MKIATKQLTRASLEALVTRLKEEGRRILAPVKKGGLVDFAEIASLQEMAEGYITTIQSAKSAVFPKVEDLLEMRTTRDSVTLKDRDLSALPEIVLLGGRPCDAAGMGSLTAIFSESPADTIFAERLKKILVISISCDKCDAKCFCTSVNGGPGGTEGSDLLLTRLSQEAFLAEIITEKGLALAAKHPDLFEAAPETDKRRYLADVPPAFELKALLDNLPKGFDHEVWLEQSLRCIGCGTCAYVCPTCACFDVQDDVRGTQGRRKRSWDSCGFSLFTLHASGHNPRTTQDSRWRQRLMHKFAYMPERRQGIGCVGCGRCGRGCPVDMDLKEHLVRLAEVLRK